MHRLKSVLSSRWCKIAVSAGLLVLLLRRTDLRTLRAAVAGARLDWFLAALAIYVSSQVVSALRWQILARPLGFAEPFGRFLTVYFASMYINLFGPSTVAGDVGRTFFLAGEGRRALSATSVLAHRLVGFIALVWIGAIAVLCLPRYPVPAWIYWAAWIAPVASLLVWSKGPLFVARRLPAGHRWRIFVERDLGAYWQDQRLLAEAFLLAILMHVMQIVAQIWLASALDLSIPRTFFFVFFPLVDIASMLPVTVGGVGIREAGYWYFLPLVGTGGDMAVAVGLLSSTVVLLTGVIGAPFLLMTGNDAANSGASENRANTPPAA